MKGHLPWHERAWKVMDRGIRTDTLAHAVLLSGAGGLGKRVFADRLSGRLLCETKQSSEACGRCKGCALAKAGTHPDWREIIPEEPGRTLKVEQIREVIRFSGLTSQRALRKIVVVDPADAITESGANALLKTLEEPPGASLFILISQCPGALPPTILSRCQKIQFVNPDRAVIIDWLVGQGVDLNQARSAATAYGGTPFKLRRDCREGRLNTDSDILTDIAALRSGRADPPSIVKQWKAKHPTAETVEGIWLVLHRAIRKKVEASEPASGEQHPLSDLDISALYGLLDQCGDAMRALIHKRNFNELLMLEAIAVRIAVFRRLR